MSDDQTMDQKIKFLEDKIKRADEAGGKEELMLID